MTVRTNKQAIYAQFQDSANTEKTGMTKDHAIPISPDITKTFLEDNSVERPELRGSFGAPDSVIISETQAISIPTFIQGGGLDTKKAKAPPVDPLLRACFHKTDTGTFDTSKNGIYKTDSSDLIRRYYPADDPVDGATILYQIDGIQQKMISARGTMSLTMTVGEFASMTFEMQSPYDDPAKTVDVGAGTEGFEFQQPLVVTGQSTMCVPGLDPDIASCVRSFSLSQNTTISAIDCATQTGKRKITYVQTARAATGEIVFSMDEDKVVALAKKWGGKDTLQSNFSATAMGAKGLVVLGTKAGNQFVVASNNYKFGAPSAGETDGIATWTFPITFIPKDGKPDYELFYIGNLA